MFLRAQYLRQRTKSSIGHSELTLHKGYKGPASETVNLFFFTIKVSTLFDTVNIAFLLETLFYHQINRKWTRCYDYLFFKSLLYVLWQSNCGPCAHICPLHALF